MQSRDRIAQGAGQPLEDAGPQEEPADILGLSLQDLLGEVVDDEAIVSSETRDEVVDVVAALHRQGGKLEGRDPTLRPLLQRGDLVRIEVQIGRLIQIRRGLVTREAQIRGSDLNELPLRPETRQRKGRICARRDRDVRGRRQAFEQERDLVEDIACLDHMEVIEHQHDIDSDRANLVGE